MKKWVLVGMLLLTICSITTFVSAAPKVTKMTVHDINQFVETLDEEETPIFTAPETITSSTTSKTVVVSGVGKAKDKVIIELYQKADRNTYVCTTEPIEITVGALGVFSKELDVSHSKNVFVLAKIYRKSEWVKDGRFINVVDKEDLKKALQNIGKIQ